MRSQKSQICILNPNVWLGKSPFFPAESPPKWVAPGHPWSAKDPSTAQKQLAAQLAQAWYGGDDQDLQSSTGDFYRKCLGVFCLYHVLSMFVGRWRPITPIYPHVPKPLETPATNMILYIYSYDYIFFMIIYGNVYGEMLMIIRLCAPFRQTRILQTLSSFSDPNMVAGFYTL